MGNKTEKQTYGYLIWESL